MILYDKGSTIGTAEGTTFTLNDTAKDRLLRFLKYDGNTTQTGTPTPTSPIPINNVTGDNVVSVCGKNIFNKDNLGVTSGVTKTNIDTGVRVTLTGAGNYRYVAITLGKDELLGKTITLQSKITASASNIGSIYLYFGKQGGSSAVQVIGTRLEQTGSKTYTIPSTYPSGADKINILLYANVNGTSATGDYVDYTNLQVEIGNQATEYEDFKKTDYHINLGTIELNKINNYVDFIDKSKGKNKLNRTTCEENKALAWATGLVFNDTNGLASDYIEVKDGDNYKCNYRVQMMFYDSNKNYLGCMQSGGTTIAKQTGIYDNSFTVPSNLGIKYMKLGFRATANNSLNMTQQNIMLNTGSTLLDYEPYGTQWYIKKSIGKVVLDGSENWQTRTGGTSYAYMLNNVFDGNNVLGISSHWIFLRGGASGSQANECMASATTNTSLSIFTNYATINTLADFKTWLSTNNTIVYYVLNTPTYTIITDNELVEQLEALYNAVTYDNVTNILQSNTGLPLYTYLQFVKPLDFSRNGLGYLNNVLSSQITDEINGEYSLTFEYPMSEPMASEIVEDRYVKEKVADGTSQIFVIRKIQKDFDKMSVYCTHLFYLLNDDFLEDVYPQNLSPKPFLDWILAKANYQLPFIANSDIATSKTARYVRKNVVESILGNTDNSMYSLWGMELKRDNWNIGLKARLGADKGEKLIFGKNITGINLSIDTTGIYTRIMPIGFDGLLLPEKYIDADNINDYPYPRICLYQFSNIRYDPNDPTAYQTLDDAYQALRDATQELFNKGINRPSINVQIDWIELSKTEEYKQYSALERVDLGDTIHCEVLGMNYDARVIKTIYNALTDRIDYFEIGSAKPSITSTMNQLDYDIVNLPQSMLDEAQANATQLITQAMGGYVYKTNSELYIMDNPDPAQAVKVWRWNINGLGYSSTGINGTYGIAMTMDGSIVADFITTGQLSANVISASTIIGVINGNTSQLKLDADQIDLNGVVTANNNFIINQDGSVDINNGSINLNDTGTSTTSPVMSIKYNYVNYPYLNEIFSYGMRINFNNGEYTANYDGNQILMVKTNSDGSNSQIFIKPDWAIQQTIYDSNDNPIERAFFGVGASGNKAIELEYNDDYNFRVTSDANGSEMYIKGDIQATGNLLLNGTITASNFSDSGWFTLLSGSSDGNSIHYRKIGKQVIITGVYYSSSGVDIASWTATTINTLSSEYRPSKVIAGSVVAKNSSNVMLDIGIRVDASGNVDLVPFVGGALNVSTMYVNLSYFVD